MSFVTNECNDMKFVEWRQPMFRLVFKGGECIGANATQTYPFGAHVYLS